jgi:Flp pilus assembly pilin Flp
MKIKKNKGQTLIEYSLITAIIVLGLVVSSKGVKVILKNQVESTIKGLSSASYLKK